MPEEPPGNLILVIDDDWAVLNSLKFVLEVDGFAVQAFRSSEELLERRPFPDAVCLVIDQKLPAIDGLSLLAELRRWNFDAPAILITSAPTNAVRDRAAMAGVAIVEKPLLGNALAEAIWLATRAPTA